MRLPVLPILIVCLAGLLTDWYIYRRIPPKARMWRKFQVFEGSFFGVLLLTVLCWPRRSGGDANLMTIMWILYGYMSVYIGKLMYVLFDLAGSLPLLWRGRKYKIPGFVGIVAGTVLFCLMWWGALVNRFNIDVRDVEVEMSGLPDAFDGYRIVQISDLHVGTYGKDTTYLAELVDSINRLDADLIVFTGDIVNRRSMELLPHVSTLSRLHASDGVFSILGNHDYGDYVSWPDEVAKINNMQILYSMQSAMGWRLLRNQTEWLRRGSDSIALIGVENIGEPPFSVYGNLEKSYPGHLDDAECKILLSHNPMHWVDDIADRTDKNIGLTLSGHTHAMQIELLGISPAALRYKTWGGLYPDGLGHKLYVNIGIGTVGTPMRIGATPEVTVITLKK